MYEAFFFLFALAAVGFAVNLVLQNHPIHSALSLIGVMASLASLYLMLGAEFIAAVQVIVYAGAIMVLFVFVIMLLNAGEEERTNFSRLAGTLGVPLILVLLASIASIVYRIAPSDEMVRFGDFHGRTADIGRMLFRTYLLPFEIVSILILVALVGAVVLARKES
ncbi:MAG: NADH-quinone oxidoreductase subunit J [Acidobacteria bacterium RIFCSPLOWO2_12_FULL_54_10]|nr:MAG: NADH-quinone oxidoreductase subunit J [Acidobacteria bacterium RIFCSPLOWO2_12_FULL_54_10]